MKSQFHFDDENLVETYYPINVSTKNLSRTEKRKPRKNKKNIILSDQDNKRHNAG